MPKRGSVQVVALVVAAAVGGAFLLGQALDSVQNALALVSPAMTYAGTTALLGGGMLVHLLLRAFPQRFARGQSHVQITALGPLIWAPLLGATALLWVPRLLSAANPLADPRSSAMVELCGAVADTRASFLEVGAEAGARDHADRSLSRASLESDLRNLTRFANRTQRPELIAAASNARTAIATGLNLPPPRNENEEAYKSCLLVRYLLEAETISVHCRAQGLPAVPQPRGNPAVGAEALMSVCEAEFAK